MSENQTPNEYERFSKLTTPKLPNSTVPSTHTRTGTATRARDF
jgi:hypothetical protein